MFKTQNIRFLVDPIDWFLSSSLKNIFQQKPIDPFLDPIDPLACNGQKVFEIKPHPIDPFLDPIDPLWQQSHNS